MGYRLRFFAAAVLASLARKINRDALKAVADDDWWYS